MPFDRSRYPANWNEIRARILERDQHRCKFCGVPDRHLRVGDAVCVAGSSEAFYAAEDYAAGEGPKPVEIVLTIAHLHDPDPMNVADDNLAALCQRCHNRLDAPLRKRNAAATRQRKRDALNPPLIEND